MRDSSPLGTKHERSMTALPAAGSEVEVKPVLAGIPLARLRNARSFTSHPNTYLCDQQDFPIVVAENSEALTGQRLRVPLAQVHGPGPRRGDEGALPSTGDGRVTAGTQRIEVAFPAAPSKRASIFDGEGFGRQGSQGEVNRLALSR